ncbi:MAG: glycosyltransferase family 2 protein, partial [Planctomycetota bacterium]|nr:glycosyltransferase family 2 protein [Planctomycetota bacterium]
MSPRSPTFSVVVPTHGRAAVLPRAIGSVLSQSFSDFELIVVDDASPDETPIVVSTFTDARLKYVRRPRNGGAAATRNTGIGAARGRFVCFLDDDDELLPDYLREMHDILADAAQDVGLAWPGVVWVEDRSEVNSVILREELWRPVYGSREAAYLGFLARRRIGTN